MRIEIRTDKETLVDTIYDVDNFRPDKLAMVAEISYSIQVVGRPMERDEQERAASTPSTEPPRPAG